MGIVSPDHAARLRLMAGYRNRLVHFYHEVSEKELYSIVQNNLSDIEEFLRAISAFLDKYRSVRV
jgi:uncharacterized protein YutE (UPF0331/DUF86 family)